MLAACMLASITPGLAQETTASLRGIVYEPDQKTPAQGASVVLLSAAMGEAYWANQTAADGSYELKGLPPGQYELAIEWRGQMLLAESRIELLPGGTLIYLSARPAGTPSPEAGIPSSSGVARILTPDVVPEKGKEGKGGKKKLMITGGSGLVALLLALSGGGDGGGSGSGGGGPSVSSFTP